MTSPITKLPDGSAFFTANVMSKEEAMDLPLKDRPLCYRISPEMYHAVFEAIGAASMCWDEPSVGVFHSEKASQIATGLCFKIAEEIERLSQNRSDAPDGPGCSQSVEDSEGPERPVNKPLM